MGLRDLQQKMKTKREEAKWRSAVNGHYTGGHPEHPIEEKRAILRLDPSGISLEKNAILGTPTTIFQLPLAVVDGANPLNSSYYESPEKFVEQYDLVISFYDKYDSLHKFVLVTGDGRGVRDFLNKLKANFYARREAQAEAFEAGIETPDEPSVQRQTRRPKPSTRQPREL